MLNIGIDVGNSYTKVSLNEDFKFASKWKSKYDLINEEERIKVVYKKNIYSIGVGSTYTERERYFDDFFKIMILTAIAKSSDETNIKCNLVIGVPVQYFKEIDFRNRIIENLHSMKEEYIEVDNVAKIITIENAKLWFEGGIVALNPEKFEDTRMLVVDIGAYSVDIVEFNYNKLHDSRTILGGIAKLERTLTNYFNVENAVTINPNEELIQKIINKGSYVIKNKTISLDSYGEMINIYIKDIINELNIEFGLEDKHIVFIGGGSILLKNYIKQFSNNYSIDIIEDVFINARTYQLLSKELFNNID